MVAAVASASCGSLKFLRRGSDSVINVQGAIIGLPPNTPCELKLLKTNGRTVDTQRITPVFDRSVVVAPAGAKRLFEISCPGRPGSFRSRAYKSNGWTQVDLGTIVLTSLGDAGNFPRR